MDNPKKENSFKFSKKKKTKVLTKIARQHNLKYRGSGEGKRKEVEVEKEP